MRYLGNSVITTQQYCSLLQFSMANCISEPTYNKMLLSFFQYFYTSIEDLRRVFRIPSAKGRLAEIKDKLSKWDEFVQCEKEGKFS